MNKKLLSLISAVLLISCLLLPVSAFATGEEDAQLAHITDMTGLLTDVEKNGLEAKAAEVSETYQCSVYAVIVDDYNRYASANDVYSAGTQIYDKYVLGYGEHHDGVLLLLSMNERDYALIAGGTKGNQYFNNAGMTKLENAFLGYFGENDWAGGFNAYIAACEKVLQSSPESSSYVNPGVTTYNYDSNGNYDYSDVYPQKIHRITLTEAVVALAVAVISGFAVCGVMKGKMKTARVKTTAENYVDISAARFTDRRDVFIRRTETRQPIPQNNDSGSRSSGGGGRSVGHSGHSGKF